MPDGRTAPVLDLPPDLLARLRAVAMASGEEPDAIVMRAVASYLQGEGADILAAQAGHPGPDALAAIVEAAGGREAFNRALQESDAEEAGTVEVDEIRARWADRPNAERG
jgi:hypothetical protein